MRVMVFGKAVEGLDMSAGPTPEMLEAFAAMDRFTEELVKAGVFVAAAGLRNDTQAKRIVLDGDGRAVADGPFPETRELVVGFSIWQVKDMEEALSWVSRYPNLTPGKKSEIEIRLFYEAEDLAGFVSPEEVAEAREGDRAKLGVA
jgi:hypothetical protein